MACIDLRLSTYFGTRGLRVNFWMQINQFRFVMMMNAVLALVVYQMRVSSVAIVCTFVALFSLVGAYEESTSSPARVWLVPHSHDDLGWLKTVDQYYRDNVHPMFESVLKCLLQGTPPPHWPLIALVVIVCVCADRRRVFNEVEMGFFSIWWAALDSTRRDIVRHLIKEKRFAFMLGGPLSLLMLCFHVLMQAG
jgi:hypothetical protein